MAGCDVGRADCERKALGPSLLMVSPYLLVLHRVLDRTELDGLSDTEHLSQESGVYGLVNVDALRGNADLAGVMEGTHDHCAGYLFDVDVG